jgi:hypothetical protein
VRWQKLGAYAARSGRYYLSRSVVLGRTRFLLWHQPQINMMGEKVPPVLLGANDDQRVLMKRAREHANGESVARAS